MNKNKIQEAKFVVGDPNAAVTLASTNKLQKTDTVVVDKNAAAKASLSLEEDMTPKKTITDKQLSRLAQQAGNFGEDIKNELFDLMMYGDKIPLDMVKKILANYDLTLKDLKGQDATFRPSSEFAHLFNSSLKEEDDVLEPEAVIAPQDNTTIKYLSNVKDDKTGEVSKPFTIGTQKYQMVRGMTSDKQIVIAVYCHDEKDELGNNIIHPVDHFEKTIALPMLEKENRGISEVKEENEETYEGSKHFLVDTKTKKVRKFKTVEDLLSANKSENEVYMNAPKFKKYMNERLFGKRKKMNELDAEPIDGAEDMTNKAARLMDIIDDNTSVQNAIKTIKTPDAKKEVIAAFAELIGVPRSGLTNLVGQIKSISKEPVGESVVITKNQLLESIKPKTVIKTIKVKDIK